MEQESVPATGPGGQAQEPLEAAPSASPPPPAGTPSPDAAGPEADPSQIQQAEEAPRPLVAVVGEVAFCGQAVVRALLEGGFPVRVLCQDELSERLLAPLAQAPVEQQQRLGEEPQPCAAPAPRRLELVAGGIESPEALDRLCKGAHGLVYLSPVGLEGRGWDRGRHLDCLGKVLAAGERQSVEKAVYLSTLAATCKSRSATLREALEAEQALGATPMKGYVLRAGLVTGRGDGFLSRIAERASQSSPFLVVWGYGDTTLQPIHVQDLGRCVARIFLDKPQRVKAGIYSVAGPEVVNWMELVDGALERLGRFKIKCHIPLFALRLAAAAAGNPEFSDRVRLLCADFSARQNDAPRLLGAAYPLKRLKQVREEVLGFE